MSSTPPVDVKAAESHLMKFLSVEGVTGEEAAIAAAVSDELKKVSVSRIRHPLRRREQAHPAADANRQPDRRSARHASWSAAAVRHAPRHRAAVRRRQAEARGRPHRLRRHDGARRRQPHRLRRAGDAGRDAAQAQASAPADHAAVHRARGKRAAWRTRIESGRLGRGDDVLQRRRQARRRIDHRRGGPGELGSGNPRQGVARGSGSGKRHLGDLGRGHRPWWKPSATAGSARSSSPTGPEPAIPASSAARTARRRATPPTSSPTMSTSRGEARSAEEKFAAAIVGRIPGCLRQGGCHGEGRRR